MAYWSKNRSHLYRRNADGSGQEEQLTGEPGNSKFPDNWSPDGKYILYRELSPKTANDLWLLPLDERRKPVPLLESRADEAGGVFSPDGRWIVYDSNESGRYEVYVRPFSRTQFSTGSKIQISNQGGNDPLWSGDGREIFYGNFNAPGYPIFSARIRVGTEGIEAEAPMQLFAMPQAPGPHTWAVTNDGQHFLIERAGRQAGFAPLTVMVTWQADRIAVRAGTRTSVDAR